MFCVLFLYSLLSPARLRAFHALSCSHLTSFAKIFCPLWMRSASAWPVGFSSKSPWICVLIRAFQSSTCRVKKTVSIRCEKSGWVVRAVFARFGKSMWCSWVHIWQWSNFSWDLRIGLADETHGHINSAGCDGMATTVTAAHHSIWRHLYDSMHAARKPKSKLKYVTLDEESNMSTLWRREEFLRICSKDDLVEKAQDIEVTIPVKKSQDARCNLDPGSFFVNLFWGRRPNGSQSMRICRSHTL